MLLKKNKFFILVGLSCLMLGSVLGAVEEKFTPVENKSYQIIHIDPAAKDEPALKNANLENSKKVTVVEFFSYGCPVCARFEPTLEKWMATKAKYIEFKRVPVVFEAGWMEYAAAYYTAQRLNIAEKISPYIFNAIWTEHQDILDKSVLQALFVKSGGVTAQQFEEAYDFAPQMAALLLQSEAVMGAYKIDEVPTLLIDGKYKTNIGMVGSLENTIETLNYIITKIAKEKGL